MIDDMMIVIFGSTGDLTRRKLIPALYKLHIHRQLKSNIPIVCIGRRPLDNKGFIDLLQISKFMPKADKASLSSFLKRIRYIKAELTDDGSKALGAGIRKIQKQCKCSNMMLYLAVPPNLFIPTVDVMKQSGMLSGAGWRRAVFEKPFGSDHASAKKLNRHISPIFKEQDIYRVDHYLGKELVQNIMVFRFANTMFEEIWNRDFVDHVQITLSETVGVETRGTYYDQAGAIRDMIQSHLLQVMALTAMEPPLTNSADDIRDEKVKIFKSLRRPKEVVVGQYGAGKVGGKKVAAYRKEDKVHPHSNTETYAAVKVMIDNKRWKGVPFYLRTGKRMEKKYSEINLVLKDVACELFCEERKYQGPNVITIRIQPEEGILIHFNAKVPGQGIKLQSVDMEFCHTCLFGLATPEAYETILRDIMRGDQTLFTRWDGVEGCWKYVDPVMKLASRKKKKFPNYTAGSTGPKEADELMKKDNREWINPK